VTCNNEDKDGQASFATKPRITAVHKVETEQRSSCCACDGGVGLKFVCG